MTRTDWEIKLASPVLAVAPLLLWLKRSQEGSLGQPRDIASGCPERHGERLAEEGGRSPEALTPMCI
jgi:hypothetical protein